MALGVLSWGGSVLGAETDDIVTTAAKAGRFTTLTRALKATGLDDALRGDGPFTVFAPTDEAFAKLPPGTVEGLLQAKNRDKLARILKYHVLPKAVHAPEHAPSHRIEQAETLAGEVVKFRRDGATVKVNGATIIQRDLVCDNGVIQVIDSVLLPPEKPAKALAGSIPEVAKKAGRFGTLLGALNAAQLAEVLGGEGPFTVFAPTDEAFAKIPVETLKELLQPENRSKLQSILKYHVVKGSITARDAIGAQKAKTLQGGQVDAKIVDGRLKINDAQVIATDIKAKNGIIHVIDTVLLP